MGFPLYQVDAFARRAFEGNPAAVCLLDSPAEKEWMQSVAAEMRLSETAFVAPGEEEAFGLRWFTPKAEVDLCGHATLASAHVLWETGRLPADEEARFDTRSGRLVCRRVDDRIEMNFPADPPKSCEPPAGLAAALGVEPVAYARGRFDYLVELASEEQVRAVAPDFRELTELPERGVMVTARGGGEYDFISRFFAPGMGIDEDPATGSAHCCLAPYWAAKLGKQEMRAFQASERGGEITVRLGGGLESGRVVLGGHAVTVLRGELVGPDGG